MNDDQNKKRKAIMKTNTETLLKDDVARKINYNQIDRIMNHIRAFIASFADPKKANDIIHTSLSLEFAMMLKNEFNRGSVALMDNGVVIAIDKNNTTRIMNRLYVWVDDDGHIYNINGCWNDPRDIDNRPDDVDPFECEKNIIFLNIACNKINRDVVKRFVDESILYLY